MREDLVMVKAKGEGGAVFASGRFTLKIEAGSMVHNWEDGTPITRAEFEAVLEPLGVFEIAGEVPEE